MEAARPAEVTRAALLVERQAGLQEAKVAGALAEQLVV